MYSFQALFAPSLLLLLLILFQSVVADLDSGVRASSCHSCLQSVEQMCSGAYNSPDYNDCFCDLNSKPWTYLQDCITSHDTNCNQDQDIILNNYGDQCFRNNVQRTSKLCAHITGHSEQLLYLIKRYCRDLIFYTGYLSNVRRQTRSDTTTATGSTQTTSPSSTAGGHSSTASGTETSATSTTSSSGSRTTDSSSSSGSPSSASGTAAATSSKEGAGPCLRGADAWGMGLMGLLAAFF